MLTIAELEQLQATHPDYAMELVNGAIVVMSPSSYESDEVATRIATFANNWVMPQQLGRVTGSSAGFVLPNSNTRAPDVSFVQAERLRRSPRSFAELAPDLIIEVKSPTDSIAGLQAKIDEFLRVGTRVGILVDPEQRWVEIRRSSQEPVLLQDGDLLTVPDVLPGWEVPIVDLWPPIFDEA